jgi:predicted metalloprotease with PDZ domain
VDCREFDGQVVRLEGIKDVADKFVRVRLTRIDNVDLNLFEFDYDLTFMVFFLNAEGKVYARYGGRDAESADSRQSLKGLAYTMKSVLDMHGREKKEFAPRSHEGTRYIREVSGPRRFGRCVHCHQVKEIFHADLQRKGKWSRDLAWRYPLPENLGLTLEVDRGNVVKGVTKKSAAAAAGLKAGDVIRRLGGVPIHSFGDAQFALDIAPRAGSLEVVWQRGGKVLKEKLALRDGWRKTDISWRPSMQRLLAAARLYGTDLTTREKKALGLSAKQLAFRQKDYVPAQARAAGIRAGDIILGVDGQRLEMDVDEFLSHVKATYLVGDRVTVNLLRDGKRLNLPMTFLR